MAHRSTLEAHLADPLAMPDFARGSTQGDKTAEYMKPVHGSEDIKEGIGGV